MSLEKNTCVKRTVIAFMKLIKLMSMLVYLGNRFSSFVPFAPAKIIGGVLSKIGTSF